VAKVRRPAGSTRSSTKRRLTGPLASVPRGTKPLFIPRPVGEPVPRHNRVVGPTFRTPEEIKAKHIKEAAQEKELAKRKSEFERQYAYALAHPLEGGLPGNSKKR
jgi:hypothetical protein